jgi:flagellar P-ring protein FlgI
MTAALSVERFALSRIRAAWAIGAMGLFSLSAQRSTLNAQTPIRDLVIEDRSLPVRLVGYGLVVGLDNTGDNAFSGRNSQHTVQSVANLLRKFDVSVPTEMLRTRNVAAVLVTAELSPYLRPGGRFEVQVASVGNARSLKGGVLWMTPLLGDVGGKPVATAQGPLLVGDVGATRRSHYAVETSGRMPDGGLLEAELPRPQFASVSKLLLRSPDIGTASRIAAAIDTALGAGTAKVEDPGSVELTLKDGDRSAQLARIRDLTVTVTSVARIVIDGRDGSVVTGGEVPVGPGFVSVGGVTLSIGAAPADTLAGRGNVHLASGTSVQQLASALHKAQMPPPQIAMIFEALRRAGSISAEVVTR